MTVTLHGLPVLVCENGHRQFAHAKFALQRLLRLTDEDWAKLPISNEKGAWPWFKRPVCADCGNGVGRSSSRRQTFHVDLPLTDATSFGIDLTMPVLRCRGCGKEQLRSRKEIERRAPAALIRALHAAGIARE